MINCREELKDTAMRKLGHPHIQINVTEEQIEDCVVDALDLYGKKHNDGSYIDYVTIILTSDDLELKTFYLDSWVYSVLRVMPLRTTSDLRS